MERRLAAILAADVAGYSRLMERDEERTHAAFLVCRASIAKIIADHSGRIFGGAGDSVMVEFASPVEAMRAGVEIQNRLADQPLDLPEDLQMHFRIGINIGDVMVDSGELFGDGVNVAARLQAFADPGGICISEGVYQHVESKLELTFDDLGAHQVKNITKPVRMFRVLLRAPTARTETATAQPPTRPSIAVLPFTNMSGDPEQQYFSDGITEDIITELSCFHSLLVIARNSSFQYRDKAVDVKRVGRDLGVQYVVEGSVRKVGAQFRITAQLVDAATGTHLWASRYDRGLEDIFATQDEVTTAITGIVVGRVHAAGIDRVRRKHTGSLAAYDCFLRGLEHFNRAGSEDTFPARQMFKRAIEIDPDFAQGHALLAVILTEAFLVEKWTMSQEDSMAALDHALATAQRAVYLDGNDALCHCALACAHLFRKSFDLAAHHFEIAMQLNPNDANIIAYRSLLEMFTGRPQEALRSLDVAMRLNPTPPNWYREIQGMVFYALRRYEDAVKAWERATAMRPYVYRYLAACYAEIGNRDKVRALVDQSLRLQPHFSLRVWATWEPYLYREDLEHLLGGMRKAGLPE